MSKLPNIPPKGTNDWPPSEFLVRKYIFDTWRTVCTKFGYEEYLTPLVEYADVYRAKSGEDIGGSELTVFTDRGGRELAIRPEMTPSVTRMVSRDYNASSKPIRLFSIANFYRNENPQRGRNREFWQLNFDIFGNSSLFADIEILTLALEIMLAFNPPKKAFTLRINNRLLIDQILTSINPEKITQILRILDKYEKIPVTETIIRLTEIGLTADTRQIILDFISSTNLVDLAKKYPSLATSAGYIQTMQIIDTLTANGYEDWIEFNPSVLRGFDYYDGMVFEMFDNNPKNNRSMFGGGRYNGLATIFGVDSFPAVGCAPGDETTRLFLESWDLLPKSSKNTTYMPILDSNLQNATLNIAKRLRDIRNIETGLEVQTLNKALEYANKKQFAAIAIYGTSEAEKQTVTIKDLKTGNQQILKL